MASKERSNGTSDSILPLSPPFVLKARTLEPNITVIHTHSSHGLWVGIPIAALGLAVICGAMWLCSWHLQRAVMDPLMWIGVPAVLAGLAFAVFGRRRLTIVVDQSERTISTTLTGMGVRMTSRLAISDVVLWHEREQSFVLTSWHDVWPRSKPWIGVPIVLQLKSVSIIIATLDTSDKVAAFIDQLPPLLQRQYVGEASAAWR